MFDIEHKWITVTFWSLLLFVYNGKHLTTKLINNVFLFKIPLVVYLLCFSLSCFLVQPVPYNLYNKGYGMYYPVHITDAYNQK